MRRISVIGLFPEFLEAYFDLGMLAKARNRGIVDFKAVDLRQFGSGSHRQVDDTPYGGGEGMILKIEPLVAAIEATRVDDRSTRVVLLTPRGKLFKQSDAQSLADSEQDLILVGGRYEGYDERLVNWVDDQFSIGSYVLTGSELPALVIVDSVVRLLDGVLGNAASIRNESFSNSEQTLEHPQYTKPRIFRDLAVPEILLGGNHKEISVWRTEQMKKFKL